MSQKKQPIVLLSLLLLLLAGCARGYQDVRPSPRNSDALHSELAEKVLSLNPNAVSEKDVVEVLSRCPAPRILTLDGSVPIVTMGSFCRFLIRMGYPKESFRNPGNGSYTYTYNSYRSSRDMAGMIAWYYEKEGMRPVVIGHSQGGMLSVKILHEFAGTFRDKIAVWNPQTEQAEERHTIIDPLTGLERPVVGLKLGFASAIGTGKGMRLLLGQWGMLSHLRRIPDTVEHFTGFHLKNDLVSGTLFGIRQGDRYYPICSAVVRNVTLPAECSHLGILLMDDLAKDPEARGWIQSYVPSGETPELTAALGTNYRNILVAAELWYSVKKQWCSELQRWVLAKAKLNRE